MFKTKGIIIVAGLLALVAVLLARGKNQQIVDPVKPTPSPVAQGSIQMMASPSGNHVLYQGSGDLYLDISLKAPVSHASKRLPLNIGLVVDRSGSMAGQKLADARQAAMRLVNRLREGDRIAIVTYGSDVTMLVPSRVINPASREQILRAIATITDRGGTFLSGGLEQGRDEVIKHSRRGFVNRVILISDGQANEGLTTTPALSSLARRTLSSGINVTTMGVGLDFNEEVMTSMAEHGGGHYYFIQNSSAMARFFNQELETMTSIVGQSATLTLTLEPGVVLKAIYGYTYQQNGNQIVVHLPDFFGGQDRKIMAKLGVPTGREGKHSVAHVELMYRDPDSGKKLASTSTAMVTITSSTEDVERSKNKDVLAKVEQVEAASTINEAMKAYARGDVARSKSMLQAQITRTRTANRKLRNADLDKLVGTMDTQLEGTAAAPSSTAGRTLIKRSKYKAYKLAK